MVRLARIAVLPQIPIRITKMQPLSVYIRALNRVLLAPVQYHRVTTACKEGRIKAELRNGRWMADPDTAAEDAAYFATLSAQQRRRSA